MAAARVSIGLPVFNGEKLVAEALDSLLAQTFEDFEVVVADNASTDRTLDIARQFAAQDPRVSVLTSDRNRGAAWNYNRVFAACHGEYFRWQAHDDLVLPTMTERCVEALDADAGAVLAHPYTRFIDPAGQFVRNYPSDLGATADSAADRFRSTVKRVTYCHPVFGLMRREALQRTARIAPFVGSDMTLLYELSLLGRFSVVPEYLFVSRPANSLRANPTKKSLTAWFDPDHHRRPPVPVDHAWAMAVAIKRAPLGLGESARCAAMLATQWPPAFARRRRRTRRRERLAAGPAAPNRAV